MNEDSYAAAICRAMERLGSIELRSTGTSMFPFIHEGDTCFFRACKLEEAEPGDVLLFLNREGNLVCHRVLKKEEERGNRHPYVLCKGDTSRHPDEPVYPWQIIGKLTRVRKGQVTLSPDEGFGRFWGKLMLGLPPAGLILRSVELLMRYRSDRITARH